MVRGQEPIKIEVDHLNLNINARNEIIGFGLRGSRKMAFDIAIDKAEAIIESLHLSEGVIRDLNSWENENRGRSFISPFREGGEVGDSVFIVEILPTMIKDVPAVIGISGHKIGASEEKPPFSTSESASRL